MTGSAQSLEGPVYSRSDISRQTIIVMVRRKGSLMLKEGDHVILYTQERQLDANVIQV